MNRLLLFFILLFVFPNVLPAQHEVQGVVLDAQTGETLPSATILLEGTFRGTITNPEGQFNIQIDRFPAILVVRYIGFNSEQIVLDEAPDGTVQVRLSRSVTELEEITVTEKDPGLSIMEIVIARKQLWRANLQTYRVEAYTRQSLRNDTSIVSITESSSIAYWDRELGHREVQLSRRQTSNLSDDQNFSGVRYQPNFYDDNIQIAGYQMVGITHPEATRYYNFRLLETSQMDGKPVYKIEVTPRRNLQPLFEGTAWVLGREYALLEVELKPNRVVNFPPPVQDFDLSYSQQFSNYGGEFWLPVDMRVEGLIRIGMIGLQFPKIQFRQVSRLTDYEINIELPDSIYQRDNWFVRADSVTQRRLEMDIEPIPLTLEEVSAYETIDSTATLDEAFRPEGFLARMAEASDGGNGAGFGIGGGRLAAAGLSPRLRYNRMDGLHLGLNMNRRFDDVGLRINTFGGYSFHSDKWDYGAGIQQKLLPFSGDAIYLRAGYENTTDTIYPSRIYGIGLGSIVMVLGGEDYFDYFRNEKMYAGLLFRRILPRTDAGITFNRELQRTFGDLEVHDYSIFGWHGMRRPNPLIEEGTLHAFRFDVGLNVSPNTYGFSGNRQLQLSIEVADNAIGSDFSYTKFDAALSFNFETFFQRRLFANTLDLQLAAGTALGDLPLQRFGSIDGTKNRFTPFGSLRTRKYLPYTGSSYWLAVAEHNFRTVPFEILGLRSLVDRGWGVIVFAGAGYTEASRDFSDSIMMTDGVHSEAGISLNSIFGILRVDVAKRLDAPGAFVGISLPRYF